MVEARALLRFERDTGERWKPEGNVRVNQPPCICSAPTKTRPTRPPRSLGNPLPINNNEAAGAAAAAGRAGGGGGALLPAAPRPAAPPLSLLVPPDPHLALRAPPQAALPPGGAVQHGRPGRAHLAPPSPVPPPPAPPPPRRRPPLGRRLPAAPRRHRHPQDLRPRPRHALRAPPPPLLLLLPVVARRRIGTHLRLSTRQRGPAGARPRPLRGRRHQDLDVGAGPAAVRGRRRQGARGRGRRRRGARRRAVVPGRERHHRGRRRPRLRRQDGAPRRRSQGGSRRAQSARHPGWSCIRGGELHRHRKRCSEKHQSSQCDSCRCHGPAAQRRSAAPLNRSSTPAR